jgi:hypothetical protein
MFSCRFSVVPRFPGQLKDLLSYCVPLHFVAAAGYRDRAAIQEVRGNLSVQRGVRIPRDRLLSGELLADPCPNGGESPGGQLAVRGHGRGGHSRGQECPDPGGELQAHIVVHVRRGYELANPAVAKGAVTAPYLD